MGSMDQEGQQQPKLQWRLCKQQEQQRQRSQGQTRSSRHQECTDEELAFRQRPGAKLSKLYPTMDVELEIIVPYFFVQRPRQQLPTAACAFQWLVTVGEPTPLHSGMASGPFDRIGSTHHQSSSSPMPLAVFIGDRRWKLRRSRNVRSHA